MRDSIMEARTGRSFLNFIKKEELPYKDHNDVNWIFQDNKGKFWFGTRSNIRVFDGKTFTTVTNKNGKAFKNVWCIIEDKKGNIWFGDNDGLWRYDGSIFTNISQEDAISIIEDKNGNIWSSSGGSVILSRYEGKTLFSKMPLVTEIKCPGGGNFGILEANDGSIWIGTLNGVYRYNGKTFNDFKIKEGN